MSNILGTIGTENYKMKDCPFYLPKENINIFTSMQKAGAETKYPNSGNVYIHKK